MTDVESPEFPSSPLPGSALLLFPACRALRRALGATAWAVFEDVVHDAVAGERGLVSATSARVVAEHLGITPGTAAAALRKLRALGRIAVEPARRERR